MSVLQFRINHCGFFFAKANKIKYHFQLKLIYNYQEKKIKSKKKRKKNYSKQKLSKFQRHFAIKISHFFVLFCFHCFCWICRFTESFIIWIIMELYHGYFSTLCLCECILFTTNKSPINVCLDLLILYAPGPRPCLNFNRINMFVAHKLIAIAMAIYVEINWNETRFIFLINILIIVFCSIYLVSQWETVVVWLFP